MNCTNCSAPLVSDAAFCPNCGTRSTTTTASSAGTPTIAMPDLPAAPQSYAPPPVYPPQMYGQQAAAAVVAPTCTTATVSLISGIVAWFALPIIGAIVAIVAGHMAKREIRDAGGQLGGDGMATAGLVLGYLQIVPAVLGGGCLLLLAILSVIGA